MNEPDWGDSSHSVALYAEVRKEGLQFYFILNAYWDSLEFELPKLTDGTNWRRWIDTALDSPEDICPWQQAPTVNGESYRSQSRSVVILFSTQGDG